MRKTVMAGLLSLCIGLSGCSGAGSGTSSDADAKGAPWVSLSGSCADAPQIEIDTAAAPPTQLVTVDICEGDGQEVPAGATVTANYIGAQLSDASVFDSSWDRGEPLTIGLDQVIPGWSQGIPGMKVGGRRLLVIPSDLAYGDGGFPSGTLIFVVDVTAVQ